jgi:hypothetical protein
MGLNIDVEVYVDTCAHFRDTCNAPADKCQALYDAAEKSHGDWGAPAIREAIHLLEECTKLARHKMGVDVPIARLSLLKHREDTDRAASFPHCSGSPALRRPSAIRAICSL